MGLPVLEEYVAKQDRPLRLDWRAGPELLDVLQIQPSDQRESDIIRRLVLDLLQADFNHSQNRRAPRSLSYSGHNPAYTGMARYYGSSFTRKAVRGAIVRLDEGGFLYHRLARCSGPLGPRGRQSTIAARGKLVEASSHGFTAEYVPGEFIRLRDSSKRLMPYEDDSHTSKWRYQMQAINEALASVKVELPDAMFGRQIIIKDWINGQWSDRLCIPASTQLYRVFNRGNWNFGGRLYGPWWQRLPKEYRAKLLINRNAVTEVDYRSFHPQIIFAKAGVAFDFDPYNLPGMTREVAKLAILIALNAKTRQSAMWALASKLAEFNEVQQENLAFDDDDDHEVEAPPDSASRAEAARLLKIVVANSHPLLVSKLFSGEGISLMADDSRILVDVLVACAKCGTVGLPIHDSIVVTVADAGRVRELMARQFHTHFPNAVSPCAIK